MKKTLSIFLAVAMVLGAALTVNAATAVDVTLTSPTITKAAGSCEKAGAVTFSFPAGAVITAGDWWYMDLPENATLCKPINYLIVGNQVALAADTYVGVSSTDPTEVWFQDLGMAIGGSTGLLGTGSTNAGPLSVAYSGSGSNYGGVVAATGNLAIRVLGNSGSRRVTLYVAADGADAAAGTLTVQADNTLRIKILDGSQHNSAVADSSDTRLITDTNGATFSTTNALTTSTTGVYTMYGQHTGDTLNAPTAATGNEFVGTAGGQVPFVENTLCINAENAAGNLFVSFASKNDIFTFTGDSQIAHTGSSASFTLTTCVGKTTSVDQIELSEQSACNFDYETAGTANAANNYCTTHSAGIIYIESDSTFGELDDLFDITIESDTTGVYFSGAAAITGFTSAQDVCADTGTAVVSTTQICNGSTCTGISYATNACSVAATFQSDTIKTVGGAIAGVHNYQTLAFNFADFVYDSSVVAAGTEVDLTITLSKYPCGTIFSDDLTIGTFVTECTSAASGSTTLLFPWFPGSQFVGWWSGYVITNGSTAAGTAVLTATDVNGNSASYTTASIPAAGQFNASFLTVADWTQASGNSANFDGTENYIVQVVCNFDMGAGFAMLGNSTEGVGYTAESSDW